MTQEQAKEMISKLKAWIDSNEEPLNIEWPSWWPHSEPMTRERCVKGCQYLIRFLELTYAAE